MVNENMVKSEIKYNIVYVFKDTTLKLNVVPWICIFHNDSKETVSWKLISSANSLQKRYLIL